jgi:hypothetical protein
LLLILPFLLLLEAEIAANFPVLFVFVLSERERGRDFQKREQERISIYSINVPSLANFSEFLFAFSWQLKS